MAVTMDKIHITARNILRRVEDHLGMHEYVCYMLSSNYSIHGAVNLSGSWLDWRGGRRIDRSTLMQG